MSRDPTTQRTRSSISVVVVPSGATGQRLMEVAQQWYAVGLLTQAVWVRPEDARIVPGRAPDVVAHHLGEWGTQTSDLFDLVGRHRRKLVRVVLAQVLDGPDSIDELQLEVAAQVRDWVYESVPRASRAFSGSTGTEVRAINLVTGATGLAEMPARLVSAAWDVNAVTSPEDRPDPERANRFVRSDSNLVPVTVLSLASVAGLFPGTDSGPFDSVKGDSSVVFGKALVVRPTVRALVGERAIRSLALLAGDSALSGSPALGQPERFVVGGSDVVVESLLDWLDTTDGATLTPTRSDDEPREADQVVTIRAGLSTFVWFAGRAMVTMGWSLWRLLLRGAESVATKAIVGDASGIRLTLTPDVGEDLGEGLVALESQDIGLRKREIIEVERRSVRMPTHRLWSDLREVANGVLDGGSLPHGAPRHMEGSRRLLLSGPHDVTPRPDDHHDIGGEGVPDLELQTVPACSPGDADQVRQQLDLALDEARAAVEAAEGKLADLGSPPEDAAQKAKHAEAVAAARRRVTEAAKEVSRLEAADRRFTEWLGRRERSLLWRLADRAFQRRREVASREEVARELAVKSSGLDESEPARLRRTFLIWSWSVTGVALFLLFVMNVGRINGSSSEPVRSSVIVVLLAALLLLLVIRSWYQGILAFMREYSRGAEDRARGARQFEVANADRRRFDEVERQLRQWTVILGWSLHTPWAAVAEEPDEERLPVDPSVRPAALALAEPALDDVDRAEIAQNAVRELTRAGWRSRAYRRLVASHLREAGDLDDDSLSGAIDRIDRDDGRGPRDRQRLLEDLESGRPQSRATRVVVGEAEEFLRSARLFRDSMRVSPLDGLSNDVEAMEDVDFLLQALVPASPLARETWSDSALVEGAHERLTAHYWARHAPTWKVAERVSAAPLSLTEIQRSPLLDVVVRIDVSAWLDLTELRLFGKAPPGESVEWRSGSTDDSVFT